MRVLYIMPRYHTNQASIIKGWQEHGDDVAVFVQYQGRIEDYASITPVVVGYSRMYLTLQWLWTNVIKRKDPYAKDLRLRYGWPPMGRLKRMIREFDPDIVIFRERSWYTMAGYRICKSLGIRSFLYNQSPLWQMSTELHEDWLHNMVRSHCPAYRYTPVRQMGNDLTGKVQEAHSYFAPFVMEPMCAPEERGYYRDGLIHLLAIGKYQVRKNHMMMLRVFHHLKEHYPNIRLEIAGECSDHFHEEHYAQLQAYIAENQLEDCVTLYRNLPREQINEMYRYTDLFILASTDEPAAVSCIEAMSNSIPAISGTDNGTADYIIPGETGEIFRDCDEEDLYCKIDAILQAPENIPRMGAAAYRHVCADYQFTNYYDVLMRMIQDRDEMV